MTKLERFKNVQWTLPRNRDGSVTLEVITASLLMDIRDELQQINRRLDCPNIPAALTATIELGAEARSRKRARRKLRSKSHEAE